MRTFVLSYIVLSSLSGTLLAGAVQLVKLTPEQVYTVLAQLADAGKAANTIRNIGAVLRRALNQALRWGKVNRNVATLVELPKPTKGNCVNDASVAHAREMNMLSPAQAQLLLDTVASHRWAVVYVRPVDRFRALDWWCRCKDNARPSSGWWCQC